MAWLIGKLGPSRKARESSSEVAPPRYVIEHAGWASVGWSEGDPTADEAISALASLHNVDFASAMKGLRKSGEVSLEKLRKGLVPGTAATNSYPDPTSALLPRHVSRHPRPAGHRSSDQFTGDTRLSRAHTGLEE